VACGNSHTGPPHPLETPPTPTSSCHAKVSRDPPRLKVNVHTLTPYVQADFHETTTPLNIHTFSTTATRLDYSDLCPRELRWSLVCWRTLPHPTHQDLTNSLCLYSAPAHDGPPLAPARVLFVSAVSVSDSKSVRSSPFRSVRVDQSGGSRSGRFGHRTSEPIVSK
jgi:hypothetical protein